MKKAVLILEAESVQTTIVAECLRKSGYTVHLLCGYKLSYGYPTKYAIKRTLKPLNLKEEDFLQYIIHYIKCNKISTIIPMGDEDALFLSKYKDELSKYTSILMPDLPIFLMGYDKNLLMKFCKEHNYPHPFTIDLDEIDYKSVKESDLRFPAIIKPNFTTGGRGMSIVRSAEELREKYPPTYEVFGSCHLQEFIPSGGKQIKVQVFVDSKSGKCYSSTIHKQRYYPVEGGSSCCNITINNGKESEICKAILQQMGWNGFADFDLIEDPRDGVLKIMEINPRIPACIKSAILSGLDYPTMIADVATDKKINEYNYVPGQKLRHIGFEMLWFLKSSRRFQAKPSWFKWIDKNLSFQDYSWNDPMPFVYGTIGNIKKQLNPEFRKKKGGLNG